MPVTSFRSSPRPAELHSSRSARRMMSAAGMGDNAEMDENIPPACAENESLEDPCFSPVGVQRSASFSASGPQPATPLLKLQADNNRRAKVTELARVFRRALHTRPTHHHVIKLLLPFLSLHSSYSLVFDTAHTISCYTTASLVL